MQALRQQWCSLNFKKAAGQKPRTVTVISKILVPLEGPIISKDQGRVHQLGTNVLLGKFMGYALNAVRSWTGGLLMVDTEGLKSMPPSEIPRKKIQIKSGGNSNRRQRVCTSHAGRATLCQKGTTVYKTEEATSGEKLNKILQKNKKTPEIQIQMLKFDKIY